MLGKTAVAGISARSSVLACRTDTSFNFRRSGLFAAALALALISSIAFDGRGRAYAQPVLVNSIIDSTKNDKPPRFCWEQQVQSINGEWHGSPWANLPLDSFRSGHLDFGANGTETNIVVKPPGKVDQYRLHRVPCPPPPAAAAPPSIFGAQIGYTHTYTPAPEPEPVHAAFSKVTIIPYVGLGFSLNDGKAFWLEPDSGTKQINTKGAQGTVEVGVWFNPFAYWQTWPRPFLNEEDAEFYAYCYDVGWDDDDCYDYFGDPGPAEAEARLLKWSLNVQSSHLIQSQYASERKKSQVAIRWPIKPSKPSNPPMVVRFGIENDLSFGNVSGSTTNNCAVSCRVNNTTLDTLLGKIGFQFGKFMPFLAGGLAYGNVGTAAGSFAGNTSWKTGWAAGGGLEYKITRAISAKLEYLYVDLGNGSCTLAGCGGTATAKFTENVLRFGIDYQFNGPTTPWRSPPILTK